MSSGDSTVDAKVIVIGDSSVGKTNLLTRFCNDTFDVAARHTIGIDFFEKTVLPSAPLRGASDEASAEASVAPAASRGCSNDAAPPPLRLHLFDTAGMERGRALGSITYRHAAGAIIVFDLTRRETFEHVDFWLSELRSHGEDAGAWESERTASSTTTKATAAAIDSPPLTGIPAVLVGNKADLVHLLCVSSAEARYFAEVNGFLGFVATSAFTGSGVEAAFALLSSAIRANHHTRCSGDNVEGVRSNADSCTAARWPSRASGSQCEPTSGGGSRIVRFLRRKLAKGPGDRVSHPSASMQPPQLREESAMATPSAGTTQPASKSRLGRCGLL